MYLKQFLSIFLKANNIRTLTEFDLIQFFQKNSKPFIKTEIEYWDPETEN